MSARVAIAATGPASLAAGREVALAGGNAVDIGVAAALAAMSTEPGIVSLAGGAFVSVWPAAGDPVVIDGNVEMPGRGLPVERFGGGIRGLGRHAHHLRRSHVKRSVPDPVRCAQQSVPDPERFRSRGDVVAI